MIADVEPICLHVPAVDVRQNAFELRNFLDRTHLTPRRDTAVSGYQWYARRNISVCDVRTITPNKSWQGMSKTVKASFRLQRCCVAMS
jgi:hypothetical protein